MAKRAHCARVRRQGCPAADGDFVVVEGVLVEVRRIVCEVRE